MDQRDWIPTAMAVPQERDTSCLVTVHWKFPGEDEPTAEVYADIWGALPEGATGWQLTDEFRRNDTYRKVVAWMPYPEPYDRSWEEPMGTWLFNSGDYTCSECGETFSDELFYISRSREPGLPGHCPGCGFPMKTKEAKQ